MKVLISRYVLLACIAGLLVFALFAPSGRAHEDHGLPEADLLTVACAGVQVLAQSQNLNMTRCRKVALEQDGITALVTVKVWIAGQGKFTVSQSFIYTNWAQQTFDAVPVG